MNNKTCFGCSSIRAYMPKLVVFTAYVMITVAAFSVSSCTREKTKEIVGFSQTENIGPWRIAETNSIKEEAAKRKKTYDFLMTDAQGQTSKQFSDIEDLIARQVDVIFLAPREYEGLTPALEAARAAKIPVFLIDREAAGKPGEHFVSFLGSDFIAQGRRVGEWLAQATDGKASIVELTGTAGSSVAIDRAKGFRDAIATYPNMKIVATQTADFSRAAAQRVMENIIQAKGSEITAVYAHNDEMALGAIQALKSAGMKPGKDVMVGSIDGQKTALQAIIRGELGVSVESNPRFGPLVFLTMEEYFAGKKIPPRIILKDRLFDATNAKDFVDEAY
ncbi:ABC transporter substrate-binding protein [Nostoc sp. DSM 114161]|jgi:ABC-type sugar transport system substrate-binding protein|uniref:ABC transporter substrate-binding protein n=1 Tax=Nostoc sp. DSM 114161 TaxID=3440143 RepID=UPI0040455069